MNLANTLKALAYLVCRAYFPGTASSRFDVFCQNGVASSYEKRMQHGTLLGEQRCQKRLSRIQSWRYLCTEKHSFSIRKFVSFELNTFKIIMKNKLSC